jgi:hypothetical protein
VDEQERATREALVNLLTGGVLDRIGKRAARGRELHPWGLHPHSPDPGSPLATDNEFFEAAYPLALSGGAALSEAALFPTMNATDSLDAAGVIVEQRADSGKLHASSIMQLCRSAMEASARTIWLLSDPDREVRRDRCLSLLIGELEQQKVFLKIDGEGETSGPNPRLPEMVTMNQAHRRKQAELVQCLKDSYSVGKPDNYFRTVALAAQWVDEHTPPHDAGELANSSLLSGAKTFYSLASSLTHGYKWAVDYGRNGRLLGMLADGLAAAVNMTECAVALYEATCVGQGGGAIAESYIPARLVPTVVEWARLYG